MLRSLVIVQLIASLLASQWLCCCTALALPFKTSCPSHAGGRPADSGKRHSCCSHRKAAEEPAKLDPVSHRPDEKKPDCPCKGKPKSQLSAPESDAASALNGVRAALTDSNPINVSHLDLYAIPFTGVAVRDPGSGAGSPLTVEDILFSRHNLRC